MPQHALSEVMALARALMAQARAMPDPTESVAIRKAVAYLLDMVHVEGPFFTVPAHARATRCRSCGRTGYWIYTEKGKRLLVDCHPMGCTPPNPTAESPLFREGKGIAHFATCVDAHEWSTKPSHATTKDGRPSTARPVR